MRDNVMKTDFADAVFILVIAFTIATWNTSVFELIDKVKEPAHCISEGE